jgi:hypothetical protein
MGLNEQVAELVETLGWDPTDNIVVEVGGTVVSGIHQPPEYNERWSLAFGQRKFNKDAFIIISNKTRSPFEPSQPMDREHKPPHSIQSETNEETTDVTDGSDTAGSPSPSSA